MRAIYAIAVASWAMSAAAQTTDEIGALPCSEALKIIASAGEDRLVERVYLTGLLNGAAIGSLRHVPTLQDELQERCSARPTLAFDSLLMLNGVQQRRQAD